MITFTIMHHAIKACVLMDLSIGDSLNVGGNLAMLKNRRLVMLVFTWIETLACTRSRQLMLKLSLHSMIWPFAQDYFQIASSLRPF